MTATATPALTPEQSALVVRHAQLTDWVGRCVADDWYYGPRVLSAVRKLAHPSLGGAELLGAFHDACTAFSQAQGVADGSLDWQAIVDGARSLDDAQAELDADLVMALGWLLHGSQRMCRQCQRSRQVPYWRPAQADAVLCADCARRRAAPLPAVDARPPAAPLGLVGSA